MHVIRHEAAAPPRATGPFFTGVVGRRSLVDAPQSRQVRLGLVRFEAGGRNLLHTHTYDQILYVTEGEGIVADEQQQHHVQAGDVVVVPAGERHWHGATPTSGMSHLAIGIPGESLLVDQ